MQVKLGAVGDLDRGPEKQGRVLGSPSHTTKKNTITPPKKPEAKVIAMSDDGRLHTEFGRMPFLRAAVSAAATGIAAQTGIESAAAKGICAQTNLSPDAAMQELVAENQRFAANQLTSIEHDLTILKERTVEKQEPCRSTLLRRFSSTCGTYF